MTNTQSTLNDYLCFLFLTYSDLPALAHSLNRYLSGTCCALDNNLCSQGSVGGSHKQDNRNIKQDSH